MELPENLSIVDDNRTFKDDPGFLVAKGNFRSKSDRRKHIDELANAIFKSMSKHGYATVRSIGPNATYAAIRAIAEASKVCKEHSVEIVWNVACERGNLGPLRNNAHVSNVMAMVFQIVDHKELKENSGE